MAIGRKGMEERVIRRVSWRIVPFVALCYFVCYLDRVNVGFAALTMNDDLGFTATVFGWGAGIFFFGYFLFEVPSNLALERFGARSWIARIMLTWGLLSAGMAFIWNEAKLSRRALSLGCGRGRFLSCIILFLHLRGRAHGAARSRRPVLSDRWPGEGELA
jgi:sugar phosphate permease